MYLFKPKAIALAAVWCAGAAAVARADEPFQVTTGNFVIFCYHRSASTGAVNALASIPGVLTDVP